MHRSLFIFSFLAIINYKTVSGRLPPYIQVCPRNHQNIANCILNSINNMRGVLSSGNFGPGYEGFPKLEPFFIPSIKIGNRNDFKAHFSNVVIRGGTKFQIEKLKANVRELRFDAIVKFPRLEFMAKYDLIFNLLGFNLNGKGDAISIIDNSRGRISMRARKYTGNDGRDYLTFEKFNIKIQIGQVKKAQLSNLFGGRSAILEEIVNTMIQTQPEFLLAEIYPPIEKHLAETFTIIANKLADTATFDEVFPLY